MKLIGAMILMFMLSFQLAACGSRSVPEDAMSNDAIIFETKKCESSGLNAEAVRSPYSAYIKKVQCVPK